MSVASIKEQLLKLLPPGLRPAQDRNIAKLFSGFASELKRLYDHRDVLVEESHPSSITETLDDWEAEYALPSECLSDVAQTDEERRSAIAGKVAGIGGQSIVYFGEVIAKLGYTATIIEDQAFEVGRDGMGDPIGGSDWDSVWHVTSVLEPGQTIDLLECTLDELKPAHTYIIFD